MTSHEGTGAENTPEGNDPLEGLDFEPSAEAFDVDAAPAPAAELTELEKAQAESADRLSDLQRLNAEYVNFSKRAKREQEAARARGIEELLAVAAQQAPASADTPSGTKPAKQPAKKAAAGSR